MQITAESVAFCELLMKVYQDFGFQDVRVKFSDRPPVRAGADIELAHLTRYREVRKLDTTPLEPLVAQLFLRATLMAGQASRCAEDAQKAVGRGLANVQSVVLLGEDGSAGDLESERWTRALDSIADDELANAHVTGVACALLLERGLLPDEGCRLFGPDRPAPKPDEPTGRATDPDPSGGFYQPLRVIERDNHDAVSVGTTRLLCGLSAATPADAATFGRRYRANENPAPSALTVGAATIPPDAPEGAPGLTARPGEALTLTAAWPSCPLVAACGDGVCDIDEDLEACAMDCKAPLGCGGSERYLWFDPEARARGTPRRNRGARGAGMSQFDAFARYYDADYGAKR